MANIADPLFQPLKVRSVTLANRIVMSAMTRSFSPEGVPGADVAAYYRRRAEGGVAMIITEGTGVDHVAAIDNPRIPIMHGDAALAGWKRVVDEVHEADGLIFTQLWHQGGLRDARLSKARPDIMGLRPSGLWGPRGVCELDPTYVEYAAADTEPMTDGEIADAIQAFAASAAHAKRVGFDGIAIHGGHGYLIDAFLWAGTNRRTDRYGGDRKGRTRFAAELVAAIRGAVGPDMPILFRFSQHKSQDYTARLADTPAELEEVLTPLADAGVDIFDASSRRFDVPAFDGSPLNLAGWAKKVTGKIAMTVGSVGLGSRLEESFKTGISDPLNNIPELMERFNRGDFDLVGVGRAILADPQFVRRLRNGEPFLPFHKTALMQLD